MDNYQSIEEWIYYAGIPTCDYGDIELQEEESEEDDG